MESLDITKLYCIIRDCEENESITKANLTEYMVTKYAGVQTKLGGTLAQCINHNANNPRALLPRCTDAECYQVFDEFFNAIIRDYNQISSPAIEHPMSSFGDLDELPFSDLSENDRVSSIRIRLGRTVKGYNYAPFINKEDRVALEQKIVDALKKLPDELVGDYYALDDVSANDYDQLVNKHFPFRDDTSKKLPIYVAYLGLTSCVLRCVAGNRDYPSGRGIFISRKKHFLVQVNKEDNIRIICKQQGGNLAEVYKRIVTVEKELSKHLEFEKDDRLGFFASNPKNIGTNLQVSVRVSIPMVALLPNYKAICHKYGIKSKEHSVDNAAVVGGIYDLSNKHCFGLTELEVVTQLAENVGALLSLEKMMQEYNKDIPATTTPIEPLAYLAKMITDEPKSLYLGRNDLTMDTISFYEGKRTKFGSTLAHLLRNCAYNPKSSCPRLGDPESYELFSNHVDPIIREQHKIISSNIFHPKPDFGNLNCLPFGKIDPSGNYVISTRVRVGRNVEGYPFGTTISKEARLQVESELVDNFQNFTGEHVGAYYPLSTMDKATQKMLIEDHFLFKYNETNLCNAGGYRDWPIGRGIFYNERKNFLCWVNEEDHLRIISMEPGDNLANVYKRLVKGVQAIEKTVKFCYNIKYGYLTCCPSNLGTALRASVHIRVPKLSADQDKLAEVCKKYGIEKRGIHGEHTESVEGIYDLSVERRLGFTELEALCEMAKAVEEIIKLEQSL